MAYEPSQSAEQVRAAEVIGALCLATDLGMGFPFEHGLQSTLVATRLADRLGVDPATASQAYYACLLSHAGCTTDAHVTAQLFGETGPAGTTRHMGALPGTPIPTRVEPAGEGSRVVISCLFTQIAHEWTLEPAIDGCAVRVRVAIPEDQHEWLEQQRGAIGRSIRRLVATAEEAARRA